MLRAALSSKFAEQTAASNSKRIRDILALREILEPEIAALAAGHVTEQDLARLNSILAAQASAMQNGANLGDIDLRFHLALAHTAKNDVILETVSVLYDLLRECRVGPLQGPERQRLSLEGHKRIRDAIAAKNQEAARQAMHQHLKAIGEVAVGP